MNRLGFIAVILGVSLIISCNEEEPEIPSVDERVKAAKANLTSELTSARNGWKINYQPNDLTGTYLILLNFDDDGNVNIKSDVTADDGAYLEDNITYRIDVGLDLELILETYAVFHYLFELQSATFGGEYEFLFDERQGDNLIFRSKSDGAFGTVLVFEPADGTEEALFATEELNNFQAFGGVSAKSIGEYFFGEPIESPRQQIVFTEQGFSLFWEIDIVSRLLRTTAVAVGTTEQEIVDAQVFSDLNQITGYSILGGEMVFREPITFSLQGTNHSISKIRLDEFSQSGPAFCATPSEASFVYDANESTLGNVQMKQTLFGENDISFIGNVIYGVNAFFIFDDSVRSIQEEGILFDELPDASSFLMFHEFQNDTLPANMIGFITNDSLNNQKWIFNEISQIDTTLNRIDIGFADSFYTLGNVTEEEKAGTRRVLDVIFEGGTVYYYDFSFVDGLTILSFYNPCNNYEFIWVL